MRSANVVNMVAKGNPIKAIRGFNNRSLGKTYKYKRKCAKRNRRVKGISRLGVFRDLNHRINYCEFSLSRDIETNPGPSFVDPSKTIVTPYSQGNVEIFGHNAGHSHSVFH